MFFFFFLFLFYSVIVQGLFYVHCYFLNIVFLLVHNDKKRSQVLSFFNYINIKKGIIKNFAWKNTGINKAILKENLQFLLFLLFYHIIMTKYVWFVGFIFIYIYKFYALENCNDCNFTFLTLKESLIFFDTTCTVNLFLFIFLESTEYILGGHIID